MNKNIVLVGFMGAGKSRVAALLAKKLGRECVETDAQIVNLEQRAVNDIFQTFGEEYFRAVEKAVIEKNSARQGIVLDCGGGVVLDPVNIKNLKKNGVLFYLHATPDEIYKRVKAETHRPLLNVENPVERIKDILSKREEFYRIADHQVDTTGKTPEQVCGEILETLRS